MLHPNYLTICEQEQSTIHKSPTSYVLRLQGTRENPNLQTQHRKVAHVCVEFQLLNIKENNILKHFSLG